MMVLRIVVRLCLVIIALGLCVLPAQAGVYQAPHTGTSYSFASEYKDPWLMNTFDDFICPTEQMIGLRWWGSYWTPPVINTFTNYSGAQPDAQPGGVISFSVSIYPNTPPTATVPFDHPQSGYQQSWGMPMTSVTETEAFTVTNMYGVTHKVYEYNATLGPMDPSRPLTPGTKYWLGISADFRVSDRQWGWHEAGVHYGAYAVQSVMGDYYTWHVPCGGHDMAFELTTVPEPSSLAACALGLIGLTGSAFRLRRRSRP